MCWGQSPLLVSIPSMRAMSSFSSAPQAYAGPSLFETEEMFVTLTKTIQNFHYRLQDEQLTWEQLQMVLLPID